MRLQHVATQLVNAVKIAQKDPTDEDAIHQRELHVWHGNRQAFCFIWGGTSLVSVSFLYIGARTP